jgi:hypothetical protein
MPEQPPPQGKEWVGEIVDWRIADAKLITYDLGNMAVRGKVLVGPCGTIGGQAFFPPGVCSYQPEDSIQKYTTDGWRHGIWENLEEFEIFHHAQNGYSIDGNSDHIVWVTGKERPLALSQISVKTILKMVEEIEPRNQLTLGFVQTQIANRGAWIWTTLNQESNEPQRNQLSAELKDLQVTAAEAFGNDWTLDNLVFY